MKTTIQLTMHIDDVSCNMQPMGKINKITVQITYVCQNTFKTCNQRESNTENNISDNSVYSRKH
jgi:hypothetical protein